MSASGALNDLYAELAREDVAKNRLGRDSNELELYDSGLASVFEAVAAEVSQRNAR